MAYKCVYGDVAIYPPPPSHLLAPAIASITFLEHTKWFNMYNILYITLPEPENWPEYMILMGGPTHSPVLFYLLPVASTTAYFNSPTHYNTHTYIICKLSNIYSYPDCFVILPSPPPPYTKRPTHASVQHGSS